MCQGINAMNAWYLIDVDHIQHKEKLANLKWIEHHGGIPVDVCIGPEVEQLIKQGVITKGCCCGHGKSDPECLISGESLELVRKLGYEPVLYRKEDDVWKIKLNTNIKE